MARAQGFFVSGVAGPLYRAMARAFPPLQCLVANMDRNVAYWKRIADGEDADAVAAEADAELRERERAAGRAD